jgi:stage III sporulation protein AG
MPPDKDHWLSRLFTTKEDKKPNKKNAKSQYLLLVLGLGIALMIGGNFFSKTAVKQSPTEPAMTSEAEPENEAAFSGRNNSGPFSIIRQLETYYENDLKELLEEISGVNEVKVEVNLNSTEVKRIVKETNRTSSETKETDNQGGKRDRTDHQVEEKVIIIQTEKGDQPIVISTEKPKVTGVSIVADGADSIQVKAWILEAVTKLLDVPSIKVAVLPMNSKEE